MVKNEKLMSQKNSTVDSDISILSEDSISNISDDINDLTTKELFRLADLHFYKKNYIFRHLYDSYNKFVEEDIKNFLELEEHVITENITPDEFYKHRFQFKNIRIQVPMLDNDIEPIYPDLARRNDITYSIRIFADVTQYRDQINIMSDEKNTIIVENPVKNVLVAIIPLMVRSKWCYLSRNKEDNKNECEFDPPGYFITKGGEKCVIMQDKPANNKPVVYIKKDVGLYVQVNSRSNSPNKNIQPMSIFFKKDYGMIIKIPSLNDVNVIILLKALGMESDKNIIEYITGDINDADMIEIIRNSISACKNEKNIQISTQEDAIDFLIPKLKIFIKQNESDNNIKHSQRKRFLISILKNNLLPHVSGGMMNKAYYITYVIQYFLMVFLNRQPLDDRDSYVNKRIDLVGDLMFELYKQQHKKMMNDCKRFLDTRKGSDVNPINIIYNIKANIVEQGMNTALATGRWLRKHGVAQPLQRLSYLYPISLLRRIDSPCGDETTMKLSTPRQVHPSSIGFLCCVTGETEILLNDGTIKLIKDMKNGDNIITVYQDDLREMPSRIKNYFSKGPEKILEIKTISGRILKCTFDHPLLIRKNNENIMINAENINIGDMVITRHSEKDLREYNSSCECIDYMTFMRKYYIGNMKMAIPIESITQKDPEIVYDFTTELDSHTLVANGFVTSNCVETPEHVRIGLTKQLTMIGSVSIMSNEQYYLIQDYLLSSKLIMKIADVAPDKLRNYNMYKVFFNGDWIGLTERYMDFYNEIENMKLDGTFDKKNTSIVRDDDRGEIRIYCDSGRLYRPVLKVENNVLNLKKSHISKITIGGRDKDKINNWELLLNKYPNIVEYIDMELQPYVMIAPSIRNVEKMRNLQVNSIKKIKEVTTNKSENHYDDMTYVKYNYCEIHPSLLLGEIIINVPFSNRNPGARNIFQYVQGRQAMCIYATNYRNRMDTSFILYKPQRMLVHTRGSMYTNIRHLPTGENCIVAFACYTGYNQEDSLIFNKTSIQRGKFGAMSLRKHILSVQKNHSTAKDDILTKPDPSNVYNMKNGSYDKLNDQGYAEPEKKIEQGDAIFGKITPIIDNVSGISKSYRDTSEIYKQGAPGIVDRVYIDIYNPDGYATRKMSIRSERETNIGDKYCSLHGQKGTVGILLDNIDMPFSKNGIIPDIIVNSHALPSRMTMGWIVEILAGKAAALQGMDCDGTPFEDFDFTSLEKVFNTFGYSSDGKEELYNGMTGEKLKVKIFIGPSYYQRLKHLVQDKIHSRARGPKTALTRQASEGRARDGGLRIGEMERDALIAHGLSKFIKEKLLDNSDAFMVFVCDKCGLFAQRFERPENKSYPSNNDTYYCPACKNYNDISKVCIPYSFKLFIQELMALGIASRIRCQKDLSTSL